MTETTSYDEAKKALDNNVWPFGETAESTALGYVALALLAVCDELRMLREKGIRPR